MELVWPSIRHLPSYVRALERGWSPNNLRAEAGRDELEQIATDPQAFVASLVDLEGSGPPITLPDGSQAPRLPGYRRWIWDGEFCGSIGLRWLSGTTELPDYCLGHIGYAVVPWKRRRGYATRALAAMLDEARARGLPDVDLTADPGNDISQRVILANGGRFVGAFTTPQSVGGHTELRFRIRLQTQGSG